MSTYGSPLFITVQAPPNEKRWGSFAASYVVQLTAVAALVIYTLTAPTIMPEQLGHVELIAPDVFPERPVTPVKPKVRPIVASERVVIVAPKLELALPQLPQPQRVRRVAEVAEVPQPQIASPKFDSKILNSLPGPKAPKIIATNTFGGSSAAPTLQNIAPSKVQTGGFGDPNGVPVNAHGTNRSNIAAAGSFDLPTGAGYGNGTGGASGARGTVASAGFGNGVAIQGGGGRGGNAGKGHIQSTSFATNATAAPDDGHHVRASSYQPTSVPVSIQSKPTPVYTSEARQLRVEGEVLLNVVFTADGQIRILNVVHGLGHGLDEAAQRAAQGVRFSPAMRDGHPVDSNATLHIVFQLS